MLRERHLGGCAGNIPRARLAGAFSPVVSENDPEDEARNLSRPVGKGSDGYPKTHLATFRAAAHRRLSTYSTFRHCPSDILP